jgi:hypothetical protein
MEDVCFGAHARDRCRRALAAHSRKVEEMGGYNGTCAYHEVRGLDGVTE